MNLNGRFALAVCSALAIATAAHADLIVGTTIGPSTPSWRAFPSALNDYSNASRPFWDQHSLDNNNRNIGNYVDGSYTPPLPANGSIAGPGVPLQWWGYGSLANNLVSPASNEDPSFYLAMTPGRTGVASSFRAEVASYANYDEVGWYNINDPVGSEVLHPFILGGDSPVDNAIFTPSQNWGLYLRSYQGFSQGSGKGTYYFSQAGRNRATGYSSPPTLTPNRQHFAMFAVSLTPGREQYLVGAEDLPNNTIEQGGDYNDSIFTLCTVPEPATLSLLAAGALLWRRRPNRRA